MSGQKKQTEGEARDRLRRSQQVLDAQNDKLTDVAVSQESLPAQPSAKGVANESAMETGSEMAAASIFKRLVRLL